MPQEARFTCLRCGKECTLPYTPGVTEERTCPHCASNSVRRIKDK
jgi:DNA-directed RNA polymerase subunit RPC12/RpoP